MVADPSLWISFAGLAVVMIGVWVRINSQIAKLDTKAAADKLQCDGALALIRIEGVAIEARALARVTDLGSQITRIDTKLDRLLERHP